MKQFLYALTILFCCALMPAHAEDVGGVQELSPLITPNFTPDPSEVEAGMWMRLERLDELLERSPETIKDPELNAYMRDIVCRLAPDYCDDIRIYIRKDPSFNAGMFPNGVMLIHTGLILRMQTEDQLAFVIGHELGHYLRKHSLQRFIRARNSSSIGAFLSLGLAVGGGSGASNGVGQLISALFFSFSRKQETEADIYGTQMLAYAGYNPTAGAESWENLLEEQEVDKYARKHDLLWSTHPHPENRVTNIKQAAAEMNRQAVAEPERSFEQHIAPHRADYMKDDLALGRLQRSIVMLSNLEEVSGPTGETLFFRGEVARLEREENANENALAFYNEAEEAGGFPPELYLSRGTILLKKKEMAAARTDFENYLTHVPDTPERDMILMYIQMAE